ncbi:amphi-Trp domain-containing protein [Streptomyces sp. Amel2xC10]|uniref:amphi-Trp domain-containing protein n=1 Tax=Streptomyces sp. Amel2xC10 TaxID=1305826 RepID=UPI000A082FCA|nr:amphi-Trp domain-containing protein [Streptomyces sp. Amel2xC10]SME88722.1 amphi-Trp domain-containing protein [Streptomyces sp. Amel2xC10]
MSDLKFEQKRSLSRREAADLLTALAGALREGGRAELDLGSGVLGLRVPDSLHGEIEVEVEDGKIELEIEFTWPITPNGTAAASRPATATARKSAPAKSGRGRSTKRTAAKDA